MACFCGHTSAELDAMNRSNKSCPCLCTPAAEWLQFRRSGRVAHVDHNVCSHFWSALGMRSRRRMESNLCVMPMRHGRSWHLLAPHACTIFAISPFAPKLYCRCVHATPLRWEREVAFRYPLPPWHLSPLATIRPSVAEGVDVWLCMGHEQRLSTKDLSNPNR